MRKYRFGMPRSTTGRCLFLTVFLGGLAFGQPQSMFIPQIADGGSWQTTLVFASTTTGGGTATLSFFQEMPDGSTQNWNLPFEENVTQTVRLNGGATVFLHTLGTDSKTSVGWGQVLASPGIVAYAIFTQRLPGHTDQDGTAPGAGPSTRFLVPFDNTAGFVTGVAIANPTGADETVSVNLEIETGAVSTASLTLPAQGHKSFALADQFPAASGHRGMAEFYIAGIGARVPGSLSIIALRFNPTGGFTTAPVYGQSGAPIIGAAPPGGTK